MWVAPVASAIPSPGQSERIFRQGAWCIRNGDITLFNKPGRQAVRDVGLEDTWGFDYAFEIQNLDDPFLSSPFLTCSVSLAIQASRYGSRAPFALNDQYLISNKYSDVTLEIKGQMSSLTIPAHKTILAASSVFFRSKFDFDETSGVTGHTSHCIIEGFSVPCIRAMLEFMYTRQIARYMPANLDWKLQLIPACEYFQVTGMHEYIAPYIFQHMGPENVVKILGMGYGYRMWSDVLAKGAASCLRSHWPELLSKEGFGDSLNVEGFGDWSVLAKYALQGE
ncbi:Kelch-like protein 10 [Rhizophlyctis rosea]|uniref:Kelch-like protein 10 n=1 Tax=Rhizophlyctis rosea TaxID=64517 RepID=A0AAD5S347_9FUNG|nr:Kelch-like protein 10 [Rhizophlyctis rosea]